MRIGFDFDNTIVSYDALFHKVAREQNLIPESVAVNKVAVRDFLRAADKEPIWTEMQGYVYGARMSEAMAYPNVLDVIKKLKTAGHELTIISHKTKHPYLGEKYDLHAAAREWINLYLQDNGQQLIPNDQIFFEITKEEKLARIDKFKCDLYIDDLPEILLAEKFPSKTKRILFDPEKNHQASHYPALSIISTWSHLESQCV